MNRRSSDRTPASSLILLSSVVFTITSYLIFNALWGINIPVWLLAAVLGLQFAALLLGSSKILTQLGAASLSALIAVAAGIGAVFLIFPPLPEVRIAGAIGGGTALIFILASFVAASRGDPVVGGDAEPLFLDKLDEDHGVELIKYGETRDPDDLDAPAPPSSAVLGESGVPGPKSDAVDAHLPSLLEEMTYEFDEPSESRLDFIPAPEIPGPGPALLDLEDENLFGQFVELEPLREGFESPSGSGTSTGSDISESRAEDATRIMADDLPRGPSGDRAGDGLGEKIECETRPSAAKGFPGFRMRSRYKVLDAASGEHYGTYYGDEGYSTLDPVSLSGLIHEKIKPGELRIVKLDWSNFDEIEVHIEVKKGAPVQPDDSTEKAITAGESPQRAGARREVDPLPDSLEAPPIDESAGGSGLEGAAPAFRPTGPRYMIYDRRTIQPMAEYEPEGDRPRIDRLTLYKMFPEYDFKTFEIDSIRWENDEVRILIRGEKKGNPGTKEKGP